MGLAASTAGVVLLLSISFGARRMVGEAMDMAKGVLVLKRHAPDPMYSRVPKKLEPLVAAIPGVATAVPETWALAYSVEDGAALKRGIMSISALMGVSPDKRGKMRKPGVFTRTLVAGRLFGEEERDAALVSTGLAKQYDKKLGDTIKVIDKQFTITGFFETGTPIYDNIIVAHEDRVREIADIPSSSYSAIYVECEPGHDPDEVAARIGEALPKAYEARSTQQFGREVNALVADLDPYLVAIAFVAGALGALGVVNTMLTSVRERVREMGVLRATGWTRSDAFRLVLYEAAALGVIGGGLGVLLGWSAANVSGLFLPIKPYAPPGLALASFGFSVLLGSLGGVYPALYASRLDPISAIRGGG
jgi:putative ABC transport system permease protein